MTKLNILICHIPERIEYLRRLSKILDPQINKYKNDVKVLVDDSRYKTIGQKRNDLMARVDSDYVCAQDDDDIVSKDYIKLCLEGIEKKVDCCSLIGEITEDGLNPRKFIHSIKYNSYFEEDGIFYRPPNHLNIIRSDIAKQFPFPNINHGEDTSHAMAICNSGLLKTEHEINEVIYYYLYRSKK